MAKDSPKRGRGRPEAVVPLGERVMVRFDERTREALNEFVRRNGHGAASTAIRVLVTERLRKDGLLK